ncbi:hypothetical protein BJ741DRAFT_573085 [Chytriomyces cf. hyalinus JEL632]|nr:hypothetical protein BJ741DRAFT_573085 [Chytriomyces cf. hyalinus JEL632]
MPPNTLTLYLSVIFTVFGLIGSALNLLVVIPNVSHIANLAPSWFLVFWWISTLNLVAGEISCNTEACRFHAVVTVFGRISSILLCFGLTLFRYLIVVHQRDVPKNFTAFYFLGVVIFSAVVSLLPFMTGSNESTFCDQARLTARLTGANETCKCCQHDTVLSYAAMAGTIVQVFHTVKNVASAKSQLTQEGSNTSSHISSQKNSLSRVAQHTIKLEKRQNGIMKQSAVIVVAFMIGWTTYLCS